MSTIFDQLELELRRGIKQQKRKRRHVRLLPRKRQRTVAFAMSAALVVSASALAAGGVIRFGAPTHSLGGIELGAGAVIAGSVKLLPASAPDPARGLRWGMRVYDTKRGDGCLEVGRLDARELGAIGEDGAFSNDALFHAFAANTLGAEHVCGLRDGAGQLFLNGEVKGLPASAWIGVHDNPGCLSARAGRYERKLARGVPTCSATSERDVYFGLLGREASSYTYVLDGERHTVATAGSDGAYILVTPHLHGEATNFTFDTRLDYAAPVRSPITEVHYRDGTTCKLVPDRSDPAARHCASGMRLPVGWVAPPQPVPSAAAVAAPVRVRLVHVAGGYDAVVSFRTKVALANARGSYEVEWHEASAQPQVNSGGPPSPLYPERGEPVSKQLRHGFGPLRPGRLTGEVFLLYTNSGENSNEIKRVVGHFSIEVPR